ncbi:MAG: DUF1893 domain-containing protein [Huintestinicola sp.]|uniref:DUF1893 domain-containing protein n=1 Tax=Huintestinicola sp. TaxID=2981661 RepID=UPI003EFD7592
MNLTENMKKAVSLLDEQGLTLAAVRENETITSRERGVKPLLELIDEGKTLEGYSAADKIVGAAAAYLYVLLGVKELYAGVMSRRALGVLKKYGIGSEYDTLAEAIINRSGNGFCPMETAVSDAVSPENALELIRAKLKELSGR